MVGQEAWLSAPKKISIIGLRPCRSKKLKARANKRILVSYPSGVKRYKVWLLQTKKCVISKNMIFTEYKVYKDLNFCEVKAVDTAVLGVRAGSASEPEVETSGGAVDETVESAVDVDEEGERLEGYQLARDLVRRRIVPHAK